MELRSSTQSSGARSAIRANVDKVLRDSENELKADNPDILELEANKAYLEQARDELNVYDTQVLTEMTDETKIQQEYKQGSEYRMKIAKTVAKLRAKINSNYKDSKDEDTASNASQGGKFYAKLPKLEVPSFSGNPMDWLPFWDSFEAAVVKNGELTNGQKLQYLLSFLDGDAKKMVSGFRPLDNNFQPVVDILKERFGNNDIAIWMHFEKLFAIPPGSQQPVGKFMSIYDECEHHIRSLMALGLEEDTFGKMFAPLILSKIPERVREQLNRNNNGQPWTLADLRKQLRDEIRFREMSSTYNVESAGNKAKKEEKNGSWKPKNPQWEQKKPWPETRNTLAATKSSDNQNSGGSGQRPWKRYPCAFCGSNEHISRYCTQYRSANDRRRRLGFLRRCNRCLGEGHFANACNFNRPCGNCQGNHNSALCYNQSAPQKEGGWRNTTNAAPTQGAGESNHGQMGSYGQDARGPRADPPKKGSAVVANQPGSQGKVRVQMELAKVLFQSVGVETYVYFDKGGTVSYISSKLAKQLKLNSTGEETLSIGSFSSGKRKTARYQRTVVNVPTVCGGSVPLQAYVMDSITAPVEQHGVDLSELTALSQLKMSMPIQSDVQECPIDILIGLDQYKKFVTNEVMKLSNGLELIGSKLGFIMSGPFESSPGTEKMTTSECMVTTLAHPVSGLGKTDIDLETFWSLEDIGIKDSPYQDDDESAIEQFNSTVKKVDGRYEVTWPYREKNPDIPTNFGLALGRLKALLQRFEGQEELFTEYANILEDQEQKGVIEEVTEVPSKFLVHYVPHHFVLDKTRTSTKMRMVFDASAKSAKNKLSINECLLRGPVILEDLCGMLIRFRLGKIALTSDIEKAFLQVGLQESERDVTRFLWLKDVTKPVSKENLKIMRFGRVAFGFISSPFLLSATIKHHLAQDSSDVAKDMANNVYVDNVLAVREQVPEAVEYYKTAKRLFAEIQMNIRQWSTNCPELREQIAETDQETGDCTKVLGMVWNTQKDVLSIRPPKRQMPEINSTATKRQVVSVFSTAFDPCGFLSPLVVRGKLLIQELWKCDVGWDDPVPRALIDDIHSAISEKSEMVAIEVPRAVPVGNAVIQLHTFCDASAKAYGAVAYLRCEQSDGKIVTSLIISKARLAPVKKVEIPKLELTATVLGVRLSKFVLKQSRLEISQVYIWTDSMCTIQWVNSTKVLSVYQENRVKEIRAERSFRLCHVRSEDNPADILSRGCTVYDLNHSELWWCGPAFLSRNKDAWPAVNVDYDIAIEAEEASEVQQLARPSRTVGDLEKVMSKFSSLTKLFRVTAWVQRFTDVCRKRRVKPSTLYLSAGEIGKAELFWVRFIQENTFPNLDDQWLTPLKRSLLLFHDENGLIRSKGRLELSDLSEQAKYPLLLPAKHWFSKLIVQDCHERLMHAGVRQTLAQVRLKYWIPQGRKFVHSSLRHCRVCRANEGGAFRTPTSPPLPPFRVQQSPPFSNVGVDYMGPIVVKVGSNNPATKKAWICLFTCAVTRAVHLELVGDQSAYEFLMGLRRFCSYYGKPQMVVCDNGGQFHTASIVLTEVTCQQQVLDFSAANGITWNFIPELAPWMGAFYERLVQTVKRALRKTLGKRCLTVPEIQTVLCEAAAVINSRPLVLVEHDAGEEALTPAHFLAKSGREGLPSFTADVVGQFRSQKTGRGTLIRRWNEAQKTMEDFWKVWRHEYLAALRERPAVKFNDRNASEIAPKPGVVVLLKEDGMPRGKWKLGRIESLNVGRDGFARSASVKLPNNKTVVRPVRLLYPLEDVKIPETDRAPQLPATPQNQPSLDPLRCCSEASLSELDFEGFSEDEVQEAQDRFDLLHLGDSDAEDA